MKASAIVIEKVFNLPVERLWEAWTNPALIMLWFGSDPGGRVLSAALDVRVGGYFEITFHDADLTEHTCFGIYQTVEMNRQLRFTWNWVAEPGVESFVELRFTSTGNMTSMLFRHAGIGNASTHDYLQGWENTFTKLENAIAK